MNRNSASKEKSKLVEVSYKPAKGGVVSESRFETKRGGQGGGPMSDYHHETAVHKSMKDVRAHMAEMMGHCFGGGEQEAPADES